MGTVAAMDSDWWLNHGLDGLVGGLIAGLVTWVAVGMTIRFERRNAQLVALEAAVAELQAQSVHLGGLYAATGSSSAGEMFRELMKLHAATFHVTGRATRRWPGFTKALLDSLTRIQRQVSKGPSPGQAKEYGEAVGLACMELRGAAGWWLIDPKHFEPAWYERQRRRQLRVDLMV